MDELQPLAIENKLCAARTQLILEKPYLGALVLHLPLQAANPKWCPTTGTDARQLYYNPDYIQTLRSEELQFVLAHEALHCALLHFSRRQHRVKHRWDLACDYAINPILIAEGLSPPPGIMVLPQYEDMTAEAIYPLIDDNDLSESMDQHLYDKPDQHQQGGQTQQSNPLDEQPSNGSQPPQQAKQQHPNEAKHPSPSEPQRHANQQATLDASAGGRDKPPPPLAHNEIQQLALQWQQRNISASQQAKYAGKFSAVLKRLIPQHAEPTVRWQALLERLMSRTARDDYSYQRPSSRRGHPAIYPSLNSHQIDVAIAMDVSGSISDQEIQQCVSEINAIKGHLHARIRLLACDSAVIEGFPITIEPWETLLFPDTLDGGGSTDFSPVFEALERHDTVPDCLVYFTDAFGTFPIQSPGYPVIWLVKGKGPVPWGQRVQFV